MGKSRKGYIMGSKLHKMALCKSPLKQTDPYIDYMGDYNEKLNRYKTPKKDPVGDLKNMIVKEGSRRIKKGLVKAAIPAAIGESAIGTGGVVPALATYGAIKTIGGVANYLDKHGNPVELFKNNPKSRQGGGGGYMSLGKKEAGIKDTGGNLPDILKLDSDPTKKKRRR